MKLNKDYFLFPERFAGANTIKKDDEAPYHVVSEKLPKLLRSKAEKELIETLGDSS